MESRRVPLRDADGREIGYAELFADGRYEGHVTIPIRLPEEASQVSFRLERTRNEMPPIGFLEVHPDLMDVAGGFYGDVTKPVPGKAATSDKTDLPE